MSSKVAQRVRMLTGRVLSQELLLVSSGIWSQLHSRCIWTPERRFCCSSLVSPNQWGSLCSWEPQWLRGMWFWTQRTWPWAPRTTIKRLSHCGWDIVVLGKPDYWPCWGLHCHVDLSVSLCSSTPTRWTRVATKWLFMSKQQRSTTTCLSPLPAEMVSYSYRQTSHYTHHTRAVSPPPTMHFTMLVTVKVGKASN